LRLRTVRSTASIFAVSLAATGAALGGVPTLSTAKKAAPHVTPQISVAKTSGTTVTVSGRVTLPDNTAKKRRATRVLLTLSNGAGVSERHTVKISSKRAFKESWTTTLAGAVTLTVQATINGKKTGTTVKRALYIQTSTTSPPPAGATPLVGTFDLAAGVDPATGSPSGTYFEMLLPTGAAFPNLDSAGANKNYTPATPGTEGGLSTVAFQPPPSPAFAGGTSGSALADSIIQPIGFEGVNFSVVTAKTDPQLGVSDPLPTIYADGDTLSGQVTAWAAQWNGDSFNQGSPKPDGSLPKPTTKLTGTYNPTTRAFTLVWTSLIVGGPFNGFAGYWHLAGTFVPAS
jgi:hypothetical protein